MDEIGSNEVAWSFTQKTNDKYITASASLVWLRNVLRIVRHFYFIHTQ